MVRSLNLENIDIFFLLNENRILTKSELQKILPKENYFDYIKGFYRRRFIDLFNKNYEFPWFHKKYLGSKKEIKIWDFKFDNNYFLISDIKQEEDPSRLMGIVGYVNHHVIYGGYKLDIILELNESRDIADEIQVLFSDSRINVKMIKKDDLQENDNDTEDPDVLNLLSLFYKVEVKDTKNALKNMFLYCLNCNKQYDSDVEMAYKCTKNCIKDGRRKELLKNYTDFSYMKDVHIDFIVKTNIIKYDENVYKCAYCEKKFESVNYINLHYQKKHTEEIALRDQKYQDFLTFIDNIDLQLIYLAEGSLEGRPWFAKFGDDRRVVYDMNHVFSGDIVLN